jgi:carbonic anhydrase/acetyltransferase-like protein (isoleucine patch superfamily)
MIVELAIKIIKRWRDLWVRILNRYYRYHLSLSCRYYGIQLVLGKNVHFYHPVRVWGVGGRIVIKDNASFAFNGGGHWYPPIGIDMRGTDAELHIDEDCVIMPAVQFTCFQHITLGTGSTVGNGASFLVCDVHNFTPGAWETPVKPKPVCLGERVRVAPEVTILKGVCVGNDAVISNKSVVQASLPARCVAGGNPARVFLIHPPLPSAPAPQPTQAVLPIS